jgi:hypothetical protein
MIASRRARICGQPRRAVLVWNYEELCEELDAALS